MKRIFLALMGLMAVICLAACEKNDVKPTPDPDIFQEHDIVYIVNYGERQQIHVATVDERDSLMDSFCEFLGSGHGNSITFFNAVYASQGHPSKETVTFSTTDREELKKWMCKMETAGKTVTVSYDGVTGVYSGIAYANVAVPNTGTQWVDLGLPSGVLWASCNVGASSPEGFGDYFAWAETTPKPEYSWDNYHYCNTLNEDDNLKLTKYCKFESYGYNGYCDTLTVLEPCDDAATAYLGDGARTPTYYEWKELMENCTFEWTTLNDVYGYRITGPNGSSIFLPGAASRTTAYGHLFNDNGCYWSATLGLDIVCNINHLTTYAWVFLFRENSINDSRCLRYMGMPIRAVRSAR